MKLLQLSCRLRFDEPAAPPGKLGGRPVFDPQLPSHRLFRDHVMAGLVSNLDGLKLYGAANPPLFKRYEDGYEALRPVERVSETLLRIEVAESGVYRITKDLLLDCGIDPVTLDPRQLYLQHRGSEARVLPVARWGA